MTVLLLNATFEPLRVISRNRAVCLILDGKAEVIEAAPGRIRSANTDYTAPAVIRLLYFVQIPFKAKIPLNRRTLMARDNHECQVAGCDRIGSTIDHIHPRARGGRHEWTNVALMCPRHNHQKSDRLLSEIGWELKREPSVPVGTKWVVLGFSVPIQPVWEPYLDMSAVAA